MRWGLLIILLKNLDRKYIFQEASSETSSAITFKRTATGILSNRRPVSGTAADSGATTPESDTPRPSLFTNAKREAAKRGLYSKFFRGPVLGPHEGEGLDGPGPSGQSSIVSEVVAVEETKVEVTHRKRHQSTEASENEEERKERKRWRKELKKTGRTRAKDNSRIKRSRSVEQSGPRAREARKRDEGQVKNVKQKSRKDSCVESEDSRKKRKDRRKEGLAKGKTRGGGDNYNRSR